MIRCLGAILLCFGLFSCSKNYDTLPVEELNVGVDTWVNDILTTHKDQIYACGGDRMERGYSFRMDGENNWLTTILKHERNASSIALFHSGKDSTWLIGRDMLLLYETNLWPEWNRRLFHGQVPEHEIHRPQIREIKNSGSDIWFVGGENLNEGVIYHSWDSGENWDFSVWDHELRDIEFYDDYQLVFGHGIIMRSFQDGEREILRTGDFFISAEFDDDGNLIILTNQGGILRSTDFGDSFEEILPQSPSKRSYLNLIKGDNDRLVACGANGLVSVSDDFGLTWDHRTIEGNPPLTCASCVDGYYFFGSSQGRIYRTQLDS
mgnify:CR=1 FL=1